MKRLLLMLTLCCFLLIWLNISGEAAEDPGPAVITLKGKPEPVKFTHKAHQSRLKTECFHCHQSGKTKIDGWGKDAAHALCISCHDLNDKGPVKCEECHAK